MRDVRALQLARGSDERRGQAGLTGFVSFMKRQDAQKAVNELDGIHWGGNLLRVGWSKSVPMPAKALYGEHMS